MEKYYLGLDMGTSSVGWAVTNEQYELIRKKGKDLWGIREFDEAQTAAERRTHRTARRNRQREQVRVGLLKLYFEDAISAVDPNFYARMNNSKYHLEDKDEEVRTPNGLFADNDYTDKDYYEKYPTIFHLRQELIHNSEPHDVRLVFLAILNMFKHRGHFLNPGVTSEETVQIKQGYLDLIDNLENILDISLPMVNTEELQNILSARNISRSAKSDKICDLMGISKKEKQKTAIIKTICGLKGDAKVLFNLSELDEKVEIDFSSIGSDEKETEIHAAIGDDLYNVLSSMKVIYDIGTLAGILRGSDYLSDAKVLDYKKHKYDLQILKNVMKKYCSQDEYDKMFRSEENGTYSAYVNSVSYDRIYEKNETAKHRRNMNGRKRDDFYKTVRGILKKITNDDEFVDYINTEIENETFMPKLLSASNGVIPYQVHSKELRKILENAESYLPFLLERDETELTVSQKIVMLFEFQIPYYIGPVTEKSKEHNGNGWVVRKEVGEVLPWNIDQLVNIEETSEEFISRMVRKCTYINDQLVMSKASLLYEKFCVLNEINNLKIDNERISTELKQDIYNEVFIRNGKVTKKKLVNYLISRGIIINEEQISGIDININNALLSYMKFKSVFGDEIEKDSCKAMIEDIIFWCTIYGESKKYLKNRIKERYPEVTDSQIKRITGLKFKEWGRFSREFLLLKGCDTETGETTTIIRALWETNMNLMELIHSERFTFKASLEEMQKKTVMSLLEFTSDNLDNYYFSAPVKKSIWQAILLIREIQEIMGGAPEKVFIEMPRSDGKKGDKGRKDSRKKQLLELYKFVKDDTHNWKELIEKEDNSGRLKSKKMYLYLTQMGKDMYTGEPIELDDLFNDNLYDIDHIYPRHFVKDDSIHNNLVLVKKEKNNHKSDVYPIESSIRCNTFITDHWKKLWKAKLITEEKYRRLTGSKEFSEEQKADFIARQLVETSQATKGFADILKQLMPEETEIVYAKAGNVSDFRHVYGLIKSRLVNDFHHANDAYLNIVVGNVYHTKFTNNPLNFIRKEYMKDSKKYNYHLTNMFEHDVVRNGKTAWIAQKKDGTPGTITIVKTMLARNTPMITKALVEDKGKLYNVTIGGKKKAKADNYVPVKASDPKMCDVTKYGGYTSLIPSYLFLVEHGKDKKRKRTFEGMPVIYKDSIKNEHDLLSYCEYKLGLVNPRIIVAKIKKNTLIKMDGYLLRLVGIDNRKNIELHNAVSMCLSQDIVNYLKKVENVVFTEKENEFISVKTNMEIYDLLTMKHCETIFSKKPKASGTMLKKGRVEFEKLSSIEQCKILVKILGLSRTGAINEDLKLIHGSSEEGRMRISGNITDKKEVLMITQSITGLYGNITDLLQ